MGAKNVFYLYSPGAMFLIWVKQMIKVFKVSRFSRPVVLLVSVMLLIGACSSMTSTPRIQASTAEHWALLTLNNLSQTPQADDQAITMLETRLRASGVSVVQAYSPIRKVSLRELLDPEREKRDSLTWAKQAGFRYGVTGTINEWHYKSSGGKEPVVGMSLKLIDLSNNRVLWQGNAAQTGWGYASLPAVADSVIADLLARVELVGAR